MQILSDKQDGAGKHLRRGEFLDHARSLVPTVADRAQRTEAMRTLPDETIEDFRQAGFFRILQPARFGGYELDLGLLAKTSREIARGCGSSGWTLAVLAIHNWFLALFPERLQREVWDPSEDTLFACTFAPSGEAIPEPGGFRLSGRWSYATGCDHVDWVGVSAKVRQAAPGPPCMRSFMAPIADVTIEDTWFVNGLRGTGSKDIVIEDLFVPAHRTLDLVAAGKGVAPGLEVHHGPLYRVPFTTALTTALVGPSLGIARGACEHHRRLLAARKHAYTGEAQVYAATTQIRLAEASAEIDAAELLVDRAAKEAMARAESKDRASLEARARHRRDCAYAVKLCTAVVDRLFADCGSRAQFDTSAIQRAFRDQHTLASHAFLNWDTTAELYGRATLGLDPGGMMV